MKTKNESLRNENEALKNENKELESENEALKKENESMKERELELAAATAVPEKLIPSNDEGRLRANPSCVESGTSAAETDLEER